MGDNSGFCADDEVKVWDGGRGGVNDKMRSAASVDTEVEFVDLCICFIQGSPWMTRDTSHGR